MHHHQVACVAYKSAAVENVSQQIPQTVPKGKWPNRLNPAFGLKKITHHF